MANGYMGKKMGASLYARKTSKGMGWKGVGEEMSERGSFVTQYMYCKECRKRMKKVLCIGHKYLNGKILCDDTMIAGKLGSCGPYGDVIMFQFQLFNKENAPCHPVRVALIPDSEKPIILVVKLDGEVEDYDEFMEENPGFIFT